MAIRKFQPGDVVHLRHDNAVMTVVSIHAGTGNVKCVWFEPSAGDFKTYDFPPQCLKLRVAIETALESEAQGRE